MIEQPISPEAQAIIEAGWREVAQKAIKAAEDTRRGIESMKMVQTVTCSCPPSKVKVGWFRTEKGPVVHTAKCEAFSLAISMAEYVEAAFRDQAMFPDKSHYYGERVQEALEQLQIAVERHARL